MSEPINIDGIMNVGQADEKIQEANEAVVELVREQARVNEAKASTNRAFKAQLDKIQSRMDGQLRVIDELLDRREYIEKQPGLPFEQVPADGSGDVVPAQDGHVHAGEEMFDTAGQPLKGEDEADADAGAGGEVVPLHGESRPEEDPVSGVEFMTDGFEPEPEEQESLKLDDEEIEMLSKGDVEGAKQLYVLRTGAEDAVADEEIRAWRAAQQEPAKADRRTRRGRKSKA